MAFEDQIFVANDLDKNVTSLASYYHVSLFLKGQFPFSLICCIISTKLKQFSESSYNCPEAIQREAVEAGTKTIADLQSGP